MSVELKSCAHGRNFCIECHKDQLEPGKTLPQMYDELIAENASLREQLKSRQSGVVLPERKGKHLHHDSIMPTYDMAWNACIDEVTRLNSSAVSAGNPEKVSYQDDPRSLAELGQAGCNCVRFGEDNPHWPCKLHAKLNPTEQLNKERDWKEDSQHENGNYQCVCCQCQQKFTGHKRRVICKYCAQTPPSPAEQLNKAQGDVVASDEMRGIAQRLREYNMNPHHINPMSEAFHVLVEDAANAISTACVSKEVAEAITWVEHLLFECGALTSTRAPSVHVYNKAFEAVSAAKNHISYTAPPSIPAITEADLEQSGLGYPLSKEQAVQLWHKGFRSEPITVLEAWEAIGHDIGCNPSKEELMDSLRNMSTICKAHGYDFPARAALSAPSHSEQVRGKYAEVLNPFFAMMENELHANAGKGDRPGWLKMDRKTALLEIYYHLGKLQKAAKDDDQTGIIEYAADVANMSMMLVDVCGLLPTAPPSIPAPDGVSDGEVWMIPTVKQLEQALESVPSFHDLSAELIAPAMLEHLRDVITTGEYGDPYQGACEELAIWKRRALESETRVREQDKIIENLGDALNDESGPTFMGEPVLKPAAPPSIPETSVVVERELLAEIEGVISNWHGGVADQIRTILSNRGDV